MPRLAIKNWARCKKEGCLFIREINGYCRKHYRERYPKKKYQRKKIYIYKRNHVEKRKEEKERFFSGGWETAIPNEKKYFLNKHIRIGFKGYSYFNMWEHRFIMMRHLNRLLSSHEIIHHKDGNGYNNEISNLCIIDYLNNNIPDYITSYVIKNKEKIFHFLQSLNIANKC